MQSSEGSFNTKFPKKPNGITNPEYSIEYGVQEIKGCFASAEVESPLEMDNIKLALQGYNYGNGYIQWAKTTYGGYTLANAAEFSDKMAKGKLWGQAVCTPCSVVLLTGANPEWGRKSGDCASSTGTGRELWRA